MTYLLTSLVSAFLFTSAYQAAPAQNAGLRIVVIEGEDAVNIIQQKTAVAPIVEVRDRNDLPVAGATVVFTIGGNTATFQGGTQTLTVITNAAGRAVATGLNPISGGAVQINVGAAFQGQTALTTITQTNVLTAQAAGAATSGAGGTSGGSTGSTSGATGGSSGSAGGAVGGAAGGGGGGLSGATLGIIGGAVGVGGLVVATQAGGGGDSSSASSSGSTSGSASTTTTPTATGSQPTTAIYSGPIAGTFTSTAFVEPFTCTYTYAMTGTMRIDLTTQSGGSVGGTGSGTMSFRETSTACNTPALGGVNADPDGGEGGSIPFTGNITGTTASFRFSQTQSQNTPFSGGSVDTTFETSFNGSVSSGVVNGQLALTSSTTVNISGVNVRGSGVGSSTVTLRQ